MHHHNHYYGQAHILSRYAGFDFDHPPRLRGYLQHGWNIGSGSRSIRYRNGAPMLW